MQQCKFGGVELQPGAGKASECEAFLRQQAAAPLPLTDRWNQFSTALAADLQRQAIAAECQQVHAGLNQHRQAEVRVRLWGAAEGFQSFQVNQHGLQQARDGVVIAHQRDREFGQGLGCRQGFQMLPHAAEVVTHLQLPHALEAAAPHHLQIQEGEWNGCSKAASGSASARHGQPHHPGLIAQQGQ